MLRAPGWLAGLIAGWVVSLPASAAQAQGLQGLHLRVCDDANEWPPYTYRARNTQSQVVVQGLSVDLLRRLLEPQGVRLQFELLPWKRCLAEVASGQQFQIALNATATPEREQTYQLGPVYYRTHTYYLWSRRTHPQGLPLTGFEDLKRLRLGGVHGYHYPTLQARGIELHSTALNHASLVQMMHLGRIDTVLVAEEVMRRQPQGGELPLLQEPDVGHAPFPGAAPTEYHMLITRQHPQARAVARAIAQGLQALQQRGELDALMRPR